MARSTARKRAMNTLYEADEKGQNILSLLQERIKEPGAQTPLPDYAIQIVEGVGEHKRLIDRALNDHSDKWKVWRMGVVDRNILRIATWEILCNDEVPDKVAIDEALSLAKVMCDDDAPAFIHGLLSAIVANKEQYVAILNGDHQQDSTQETQEEPSDTAESPEEETDLFQPLDSPEETDNQQLSESAGAVPDSPDIVEE